MGFDLKIIDIVEQRLCQDALNNDRDYTHFHPSEWGKCHRKIAYEYYEAQGYITVEQSSIKIDARLERIFGNGHGMHDRWREYLEKTGMLRGRWQCLNWMAHEKPKIYGVDDKLGCLRPQKCDCGSDRFQYHEIGFLDPNTLWGGHVDAVLDARQWPNYKLNGDSLTETHIVVDFKTMNTFSFKKLSKPTPEHIVQMQVYLYLSGLKEGRFVYEDKNDQNLKEFIVPRNDTFLEKAVKQAKRLKYIVEHTNAKGQHVLPQRPKKYTSKSNTDCLNCKYRGDCWK